ncbi:MAG: hypothetical protein M1832_000497 [Thelocarpon impressellum]|nr:MAG: hypothetical protein M1832_000497 [Thelocarpon impressellum]
MGSKLVLLNSLIPVEEVRLGGLVSELLSPQTNAFSSTLPLESENVYIDENEDFGTTLARSRDDAFRSSLTRLLNTMVKAGAEESVQLSSAKSRNLELRQPRKVFTELCALPAAREWLESGVREGEKSYLVIGYRTVSNATFTAKSSSQVQLSGDVTVPVSTIATGGADVLGLGSALDVSVGADHGRSHTNEIFFRASGEKIWAIRYQKVSFKLFKHRSAETAYLEKPRWVMLTENRASAGEEKEEVELDLEDLEEDDVEENGLMAANLDEGGSNESYLMPEA